MLVSESLLARMADPDDDFVAVVCAHEVSHLWFGCHISSRWWDDLWLDEAMASYVSYLAMAKAGMADPWTALSYRERPDGLDLDGDLRGRLLRTLAARGLATDEDLDALVAADPVAGERNRAACLAARPDAAAKEAAWQLALGGTEGGRGGGRGLTEAAANALWVPGQEALLAGYRDRYFAEALPALDGRDIRQMRRLARALYPVTLAEPATPTATEVGAERDELHRRLRLVLPD